MGKVKINYINEGVVYEADAGKKLSEINEEAGFPQDLVCGGNGKCGKCATEIIDNGKTETVLSCQFKVDHDIDVVKIMNLANKQVNVLTSKLEFTATINPYLRSFAVNLSDIMADHINSFMDKIEDKYKIKKINLNALKLLARYGDVYKPDRLMNLILYKDEIIDIQVDKKEDIYGFAIDIGSTTVAGYLYNMETMELAGTYSALNKQTALGADVISRISYALKHEDGLDVLQEKVFETINQLIADAKADGIKTENIYNVILCGNSTMQHLFLGLYPDSLGKAPFTSASRDFVDLDATQSGLHINENGKIVFLPLIGSFVGADTMAVLISVPDDKKPRILIDLGTNGEIAVGTDDNYVVASTACGPALEGAGLACGMRAAAGAIQHFDIDENQNLVLDIIDNVKPVGICGSGIIDILAVLLKNHVMNRRGKMYSKAEYEEKYGADKLSERLIKMPIKSDDGETTREQNVFVLATAEESGTDSIVYFAQTDARYVQLAKAAIATGTEVLVDIYKLDRTEFYEVCLAGAFGNYLDVDNAQYIGLLPDYEGVPVRSIGNGAGTGVQLFLLDQAVHKRCQRVQKNAHHTELNLESEFKDVYFAEMEFTNAD